MANCPTCGTQETPGQQFCSSCGSPTSNTYSNLAPLAAYPTEAAPSTTAFGLASFWKRFLGYLIDYLILFVIGLLILSAFHASFATDLIVATALTFLYSTLLIGYRGGQTVGMRIVSVRCVDEDGVSAINYARAAKRGVAYGALALVGSFHNVHRYAHPTTAQLHLVLHQELIFFVFLVPHLVDLLWMLWDKRNQTLHDKFAHTVVINTK